MNDYAELCAYGNIEYTPAWYYQKFPGFFNVDCYRILAGWDKGVRTEEQVKADQERAQQEMEAQAQAELEELDRKNKEFYQSLDTLKYRWNTTLNQWQTIAQSTPESRLRAYSNAMEMYTVQDTNDYTLSGDKQEYEVSEALNKKRKFESEDF